VPLQNPVVLCAERVVRVLLQVALSEAAIPALHVRRLQLLRLVWVRVQRQAIQAHCMAGGSSRRSCGLEAGRSRQDRRQSAWDAPAAAVEQEQVARVRLVLHRCLGLHRCRVAVDAATAHVTEVRRLRARGERVVRCPNPRGRRSGR
jgi:hypothetical protein